MSQISQKSQQSMKSNDKIEMYNYRDSEPSKHEKSKAENEADGVQHPALSGDGEAMDGAGSQGKAKTGSTFLSNKDDGPASPQPPHTKSQDVKDVDAEKKKKQDAANEKLIQQLDLDAAREVEDAERITNLSMIGPNRGKQGPTNQVGQSVDAPYNPGSVNSSVSQNLKGPGAGQGGKASAGRSGTGVGSGLASKQSEAKDDPEYLQEEPSPFLAFSNMVDARQFQVNIENYNEIDFFKHEIDMRKVLQGLIEPVMKQQASDREAFVTVEHKIGQLTDTVHGLQDIVFNRDKVTGRMSLFDRIFEEIKNVDTERIKREQEIKGEQRLLQQSLKQMQFEQEQQRKSLQNFDGILKQLNKDLVAHSQRQLEWQNRFLQSYDENQGKLIAEISKNRAKHSEAELRLLKVDQKIQFIEEFVLRSQGSLQNFEERLQAQQSQINDCQYEKQDKASFKEEVRRIEKDIHDLRYDSENHANHFAMVENFVEKYVPVRIQSQISETLQCLLPKRQLQELEIFEKEKFKDLHQIILDDDGTPDLFKSLREIRMEIGNFDFANYKGIHVQRRRQALAATGASAAQYDDSIHSGSGDESLGGDGMEDPEEAEAALAEQSKRQRAAPVDASASTGPEGGQESRLQPSLRKTRGRPAVDDSKDEREILNEQQDRLIDEKLKKKAGLKLVKSEKKAKAIFKRKLQGLGFNKNLVEESQREDAEESQKIEEEDGAESFESDKVEPGPTAEAQGPKAQHAKSEETDTSHTPKPLSTGQQTKTHQSQKVKSGKHRQKLASDPTQQFEQMQQQLDAHPVIHSKYLNLNDGHGSSTSQGQNSQAMQQIRKLEQVIAKQADQIEQLDKADRMLRLDQKELESRISGKIERVQEFGQSQIKELNEYMQNLHKEVTIFVEKKKTEAQGHFVELQSCLQEQANLKKYIQTDVKQEQDQLALLVTCILEMLKLGRSDQYEQPPRGRLLPNIDSQTDKEAQNEIRYKQLRPSTFNSTAGSNFYNQYLQGSRPSVQARLADGQQRASHMNFAASRKSNSIKNANSNSMRNLQQNADKEQPMFPSPYQQNYLNPVQVSKPFGSKSHSRNHVNLPYQRSQENLNFSNYSMLHGGPARAMNGAVNLDTFQHGQKGLAFNIEGEKLSTLNQPRTSSRKSIIPGGEQYNDANGSNQSKMVAVGLNQNASERTFDTPAGAGPDEDNLQSFGDTGTFDKKPVPRYQFGSKQKSRGKQQTEPPNSRKEKVHETNRTQLTYLQTGSSFNPVSTKIEMKVFQLEYSNLIFQILLDKCLEVIGTSKLFKSNNLSSNRIIKDIKDYLTRLGITPQPQPLGNADHFLTTPDEEVTSGQQASQHPQHHTFLIDRLRHFTRQGTPDGAKAATGPENSSKIGLAPGNIQIEPFLGLSTPEIEDSMLRGDTQTPTGLQQEAATEAEENKKDYGSKKSASTSPIMIGIEQNGKRYSKAANGTGQSESINQKDAVQTKRIDESSIDKEENSTGPNGAQVKSLMSRVGSKGVRGDREASDAKYQNSDLKDIVNQTNRRSREGSNTEEITKTQDMELKHRSTPSQRKMNFSLASKQDLTLMKKYSKVHHDQSQITISADDNAIPQSLQASEHIGNERKISYNFQNINQQEQAAKERRGGNSTGVNKPEATKASMIQNLIKNKI